MNDRYGVDPSTPQTVRDLADLLRLFGMTEGRFIVDFPWGWTAKVREHMRSISDLAHAEFVERWLSRGGGAVLPCSERFAANISWAENARLIRDKVCALVGPPGSPPTVKSLEALLLSPDALPDARGSHIHRTPSAYVSAAEPLLQTCPKLALVDRYFRLWTIDSGNGNTKRSGFSLAFEALLKAAADYGRVSVFKLWVAEREARMGYTTCIEEFERGLEFIQERVGAMKISVEYDFLDFDNALDSHARYLLGNHGGLQFDWGFDVDRGPGKTQHVKWIERSVFTKLANRFL